MPICWFPTELLLFVPSLGVYAVGRGYFDIEYGVEGYDVGAEKMDLTAVESEEDDESIFCLVGLV